MEFQNIAVIGAGTMGSDVAFHIASIGQSVLLKDISEAALTDARGRIERSYKPYRMLNGDLTASMDEVLAKIQFTIDIERLKNVDFVIENIPENLNQKRKLYEELREVCSITTVFGVNTSCIPIAEIASSLPNPENVIGIHFMNPVPLMPLVELIPALRTSEATIARVKDFLKTIRKMAVSVVDSPGFVANRLSHLLMNEAAILVQEKLATAEQIDIIFKKGYGHKLGPLETADLIGLDTVVNSLDVLHAHLKNPKFACCRLLRDMVAAGVLGRKSGRGFYIYA